MCCVPPSKGPLNLMNSDILHPPSCQSRGKPSLNGVIDLVKWVDRRDAVQALVHLGLLNAALPPAPDSTAPPWGVGQAHSDPSGPLVPASSPVLRQQPEGAPKNISSASLRPRPVQQLPGALRMSQATRPRDRSLFGMIVFFTQFYTASLTICAFMVCM